jgi:hypothetical protein
MIIGKKGSGKTAIFKKIVTTKAYDFFAYGHTFSDYPWHYHERQARVGIPEFDKYTHSWKYLILLSAAKIALNQDQSLPHNAAAVDDMIRLESFVIDNARVEYSEYFLREIDDEVHKHLPDYEKHLDVLRALGKWQFERAEYEEALKKQYAASTLTPHDALERLYELSFIGFYRAGGRGFGGSEYMFKYRESRTRFDHAATRFRIHPGLIEVLGLKRV